LLVPVPAFRWHS